MSALDRVGQVWHSYGLGTYLINVARRIRLREASVNPGEVWASYDGTEVYLVLDEVGADRVKILILVADPARLSPPGHARPPNAGGAFVSWTRVSYLLAGARVA